MPSTMPAKNDQLGFRINAELKTALLTIAKREGRSLAQICELFLKGGMREYEREGPKYLQRLLQK